MTITCRRCHSWCKVRKVHLDTMTPLRCQMLVSTEYPQEQAETEWRVKPIAPRTSLQALGPQTTVPTIKGNSQQPPSLSPPSPPPATVTPAPELPQPPASPQIIVHQPQMTTQTIARPLQTTPPIIIPSILPPLPLPACLAPSSHTPTPVPPSPSPSTGIRICLPGHAPSITHSQSAPQSDSHLAQLQTQIPKLSGATSLSY